MSKIIILLMMFSISSISYATDANTDYSGIWQDVNNSSAFYVVKESGDSRVLIALPGIEESGDTLRYSYIGDKSGGLLTRLSDDAPADIFRQIHLHFLSENTGEVFPNCEACGVVITKIVRIF